MIITQKYIAWIYITELKKEIQKSDQTYTLNFIDRTNLENIHLCIKKKHHGNRGEVEEIYYKYVQFKHLDLLQNYNIIKIKT